MPWTQLFSFNGGEISPMMFGRPDFAKYASACRKMLNFFVHPQGGCSNRSGTQFIGQANADYDATFPGARLIPFVFSRTEAYCLVFTHLRMEVVFGSGFLPIDDTEGQTTRFHADSPYTAADLPLIKYQAQTGDTMFLTCEGHEVYVLTRTGAYTWTLEPASFGPTILAPIGLTATYSATPGTAKRSYQYVVTAVKKNAGESYPSALANVVADSPWPAGKYVTVQWAPVLGADSYNVYKNSSGTYGWIGSLSASGTLRDEVDPGRAITVHGLAAGVSPLDTDHALGYGGSVKFDADRYLTFPANGNCRVLNQTAYVKGGYCSMWVKIPATITASMTLIEVTDSWKLWIDGSTKYLKFQILPSGTVQTVSRVFKTGVWNYLGVGNGTDTDSFVFYWEASAVLNPTYTRYASGARAWDAVCPATTSSTVYVGANSSGAEKVSGFIDELVFSMGDNWPGLAYYSSDSSTTYPAVPTSQTILDDYTEAVFHFDITALIDDAIDPSAERSPPEPGELFTSPGQYPGCGAIFNQRLMLGRTTDNPQTVYGSRLGDYYNFSASLLIRDDDAVTIPIASRQLAEIYHMVPLEDLVVFTGSTYFTIAGAEDRVLAPTNIMVRPKAESPCSPTIPPIVCGSVIFFVEPTGTRIMGLGVDFSTGGFDERIASLLAEHLPRLHPMKEWSYARAPDSIIYCVCTDGSGLMFTYLKEHDVYAFSQFTTADGDTLHSVAVVPSATRDVPYFVVARVIGGVTKYYIEMLTPRSTATNAGCYFLDSSLKWSSGSKLWPHLSGRTVGVIADGIYLGTQVVTNNTVTGTSGATEVVVGLPYTCEVQPVPPATQSDGPQYGRTMRLGPRLKVQVNESIGGAFAPVVEDIAESYYTGTSIPATAQPFTGCVAVDLEAAHGPLSHLKITQTTPHPLTLVSINAEYLPGSL